MSTAIDAGTEIGELLALSEPFAWTDQVASTGSFGHYVLHGMIKPSPSMAADTPAISARSRLLDRAEQLLDALAGAGWQPMDSFRMEFTTSVRNFLQTLDGVMMQPSEQFAVTLTIDLRVGRAR